MTDAPTESTLCARGMCLSCTVPGCQHLCHEALGERSTS